jgi:hypothetical protein
MIADIQAFGKQLDRASSIDRVAAKQKRREHARAPFSILSE